MNFALYAVSSDITESGSPDGSSSNGAAWLLKK